MTCLCICEMKAVGLYCCGLVGVGHKEIVSDGRLDVVQLSIDFGGFA